MSGGDYSSQPRAWLVRGAVHCGDASAVFRCRWNRIYGRNQIRLLRAGIFGHYVFAHRTGGTSAEDSRYSKGHIGHSVRERSVTTFLHSL